ncbi:MAG: hypothetical protein NT075_13025 [Chloroflexi bacterium]|nr:hypothetical protein [Chloroflexota bacterium]
MEKISLEINKKYEDGDGNTFVITSICVEILANHHIDTVIAATANGEFYWFRLPLDEDKIKTWRKV